MSLRVRNYLNDPVDLKFDAEFDGDGFKALKRRLDLDIIIIIISKHLINRFKATFGSKSY